MQLKHFLCLSLSIFIAHSAHTSDAKISLADSIEIHRLMGDYEKAQHLLTRMIDGTDHSRINVWLEKAEITRLQRDYDTSLRFLDSANILLKKYPDENYLKSRELLYRGKWVRSKNSDNIAVMADSVLQCFDRAWKYADNPDSTPWLKVDIAFETGRILHRYLSRTAEAKPWYDKAVEIMTGTHATDYRRGFYLLYTSIFYNEIGDYERSILLVQLSVYIMKHGDFPDNDRYVDGLQVLTNSYYDIQRYAEAIDGYASIIRFVRQTYGESDPELIVHYSNISQPLLLSGRYDEAIDYSRKAENLILSSKRYENYLPWIFNNLAEANEFLGHFSLAEQYLNRSVEIRKKQSGFQSLEVHEGLRYIGDYYYRRAMYRTALEYYQKSMTALFNGFHPADLTVNPDFSSYSNTETLFFVLFGKAAAMMSYWEETNETVWLQGANELFTLIYYRLSELLNSGYMDKSSMQVFRQFAKGFDQSIACSVALYETTADEKYLEQAWQYVEKNRYFLLHKALSNATQWSSNTVAVRKLAHEADETILLLNRTDNEDSVFLLSNKLLEIQNEKSRVMNDYDKEGINISSDNSTLTLDDIRGLVNGPNDALVGFHWTDRSVYSFLMHQGQASLIKTEINPALRDAVKNYRSAIARPTSGKNNFLMFTSAAYTLYTELIKPIEEVLANRNLSRLIVVPDGPLATLPMEALITSPDSTSISYWGLDYLCRKYVVNYAYSLGILRKNLEKAPSGDKPALLALSYSDRLDESADPEVLRSQNELPYSAEEILRIRKLMPADCFLGYDATESRFKRLAPDYSIIHLALHGQADTTDMFNSRIILKHSKDENEDGQLHAFELYDMDLSKLQLIVLSACETGLGEIREGEGIFSIARGFAYAGCPAMVLSLWQVNDKATADLVSFFYKNLSIGEAKDEALRNAKLSFIASADDQTAHPANWAAFIALGNNKPILLPETDYTWTFGVFAFVLLVAGYGTARRYSIKKTRRSQL